MSEHTKQNFEARQNPPTVDDIARALDNKTIQAAKNVIAALQMVKYTKLEQFNFGPLSLETIREAQKESIDFIEYGCFTLPYAVCMYRCSVAYDNATVGYTILMVDGRSGSSALTNEFHGIACVALIHSHSEVIAIHSINMLRVKDMPALGGRCVELQIPHTELAHWGPIMGFDPDNCKGEEAVDQLTEGALVSMGLTMILNTKGVLKQRHEPAAKPAAARLKAGRPPLPYVTSVYTSVYNAAVAPGPAGTHASPRPHKRRAHIRHYPKTDKHEAYVLPIEAMLVNWDGKPLAPREAYKVK